MDQTNQCSSSSILNKRKRGRPPRSDEVHPPVTTTAIDENLIGRMVSGVVQGSFEAGYFLNVKVADTDKQLKGIVFLPGKVSPVTPTTDLFPQAMMYAREDVILPSLNQQTQATHSKKDAENQTEAGNHTLSDIHLMRGEDTGSEAIEETNLPMDAEMTDVGGSSADQTLSLMPQFARDDGPKEDHTVLISEACGARPETNRVQATGSSSTLSLELFQKETKPSRTEEESRKDAETAGMEEKRVSPVDDVPAELQLELGNKKTSASAPATETNASSKGGFFANLLESREETVQEPEETNTGSESGFPEVDDNDS